MQHPWEFWIDVGGTFTDCLARTPDDRLISFKTLSSGVTKGRVDSIDSADGSVVHDRLRAGEPDGLWVGAEWRLLGEDGSPLHVARVTESAADAAGGRLTLDAPPPDDIAVGATYELTTGEPAPVLAVRRLLGLRRDEPIPPIVMKLGTTRGTNALLERKGARTAFVTTRGFADVLLIGNQNRPRLFDLAIVKPTPLFERVIEIDERLAVDGTVLAAPDPARIREQLRELKAAGIESVAVCLLHAFENDEHERLVERLAREIGFEEISVSSRLAPLIKIVSRGDTTVMDAYLNPILRRYVGEIRRGLRVECLGSEIEGRNPNPGPQLSTLNAQPSTIRLMTSAGGLVDADRFVGKDSILSGPAGGVIGFSRVARQAGFEKAIGFDMGGTSTDVARYDGRYEMEYETEKAGVRVVAPMLAIETVAAGGGSICGFDGVKLFVGPESAGADPGPACYGRGGPLCVTDVNLYLGKILPARFPFPLDRNAVEQRLRELCARIAASPLGADYTPTELAEGFVRIANANIVRAIRRISVAKGYDPAEYALVTFGGAGAQHACEIAAELGVRDILIHPFAGILSAYGIGLADIRRFAERAVLRPCSDETLTDLQTIFAELERQARDEVLAEGLSEDRIRPAQRSLDMRYHGADASINVPLPGEPGSSDTSPKSSRFTRRPTSSFTATRMPGGPWRSRWPASKSSAKCPSRRSP